MKLFKKVMASVLAGVLALSMVACSNPVDPTNPGTPADPEDPATPSQVNTIMTIINSQRNNEHFSNHKAIENNAKLASVAEEFLSALPDEIDWDQAVVVETSAIKKALGVDIDMVKYTATAANETVTKADFTGAAMKQGTATTYGSVLTTDLQNVQIYPAIVEQGATDNNTSAYLAKERIIVDAQSMIFDVALDAHALADWGEELANGTKIGVATREISGKTVAVIVTDK